ncbi:hypothetical protein ETB97_011568 [Aspergillus alliaceus]|uniref:Uncharacterized protein n=1 Tax=Petromyces alliaceus TaxID=209559 RepID=A0A8H5ZVR2_PETAA|nr:hypothetical protein ETB97_011568 [Aspergillus burnettii]
MRAEKPEDFLPLKKPQGPRGAYLVNPDSSRMPHQEEQYPLVNQNEENDQSSSSQSPSSNGQNEAQSDQSTSNLGSSDLGSKPAVAESTSNNNPQTLDNKQSAPVSSQSNNGLDNAWNPGSSNAWHSSGQPVTGDNQNSDASVSNVQLSQPSAPESNSKDFQPSTEEQSGLNMLTPDTQNGFNDLSGSNSVQSAQAPSNGQDDAQSSQPRAAESVGEGKPYDEQAYKNIVNPGNSAYDQMRQNWNNGKYIPGVDGFNDNNNPIFDDRGNYDAAVSESQSYDPSTKTNEY